MTSKVRAFRARWQTNLKPTTDSAGLPQRPAASQTIGESTESRVLDAALSGSSVSGSQARAGQFEPAAPEPGKPRVGPLMTGVAQGESTARLNAQPLGWSERAAVPSVERVGVELGALTQWTPLNAAGAVFDSVQRSLLAVTGPAALAAANDPKARAELEQQADALLLDLDRRFRDVTRTHAPAAAVSPNATDDQGRAFATASFAYERALKAAIEFREALSSAPGPTAKPPLTADALQGRVAVLFTNSANFVSSLPVHSVQNASPFTHAALLYRDPAGQLWVVEMSNGIVHTRWEDFLAAQPPRWAVYELSSQQAREKVEARVDSYVAGLEGKRWSLVEDEDSLPCVGVVDGLLGQALGTPGVLVNSEAAGGEGNERRFLDLLGPDLVRQYRQNGVREPGSLVFNPALQLSSLHHDPRDHPASSTLRVRQPLHSNHAGRSSRRKRVSHQATAGSSWARRGGTPSGRPASPRVVDLCVQAERFVHCSRFGVPAHLRGPGACIGPRRGGLREAPRVPDEH
jgi:hypothetical protein